MYRYYEAMAMSTVDRGELGGHIMWVFLNTVLITALLAGFTLWRYRTAVLVGMRSHVGAPLPLPTTRRDEKRAVHADVSSDALDWERATHRRVALLYMLSVGIAAIPLALLYLMQSNLPHTPAHIAMVASLMLSAAAPMVTISLAWPWQRGVILAVIVLLAGASITTLLSMLQRLVSGALPSIGQLQNFVLYFAAVGPTLGIPLVFLLCSGAKRLRGVVPTIFAALILFCLAPWGGYWLVFILSETRTGLGFILATVGHLGLYAPFFLLALPAGLVAWRRLHALASSYARKRMSDAQLVARMWWFMFVADIVMDLINSTQGSLIVSLVSAAGIYVAFSVTNQWLFAHSGLAHGRRSPRNLLLLRTFGYRARTEKLFDRIGSRWRYFGPVSVIAAPDVVARTVDPGDFLAWLTGRVDESFVRSQSDLQRRLATFDSTPDPDGRYRVNEFCCHDDTWQATVVSLLDRADAIVMDLRGLKPGHSGCEFELEQIAAHAEPSRVVLVIDHETNRDMLARAASDGQVHWHVVVVERGKVSETNVVFEALLRAAG